MSFDSGRETFSDLAAEANEAAIAWRPSRATVQIRWPGQGRTVAAANVLVGELLLGLCRVDPLQAEVTVAREGSV
jgi:hypothetical protein